MFDTFRKSMAWLHTWAGVVLGSLLMVIFFMGTLSVFDNEIDRWMMPSTRLTLSENFSMDRMLPEINRVTHNVDRWTAVLPDDREPIMRIFFRNEEGEFTSRIVNPITGKVLPDPGTFGAGEFFYPLHYGLHIKFMNIGIWIVGLAAMAMLILMISGIVIHIRIFKDFFTFRPKKQLQRSSLDLHNLTGVLALPFHFLLPLSGLFIFFSIYLPAGIDLAYKNQSRSFFDDAFGNYKRQKADIPTPIGSIDAMLSEARQQWKSGEPGLVRITNAGDKNAVIEVRRKPHDRIAVDFETIYFDGVNGHVIKHAYLKPAIAVQQFFAGLHLIKFDHWLIRWFYFLAGLLSCVMIATGFIVWIEKRKTKLSKKNIQLVNGIACTATTGLLIATISMFIANRLIPYDLTDRARWEVGIFFMTWIISAIHAWSRDNKNILSTRCWYEQSCVIALIAIVTPILNWITTDDSLYKSFIKGHWTIFIIDMVFLSIAIIAALVSYKLKKQVKESYLDNGLAFQKLGATNV